MSAETAQETTVINRAYRLTLDPTPRQEQQLLRWAGASRFAYNHALAAKKAAHRRWLQEVAFATYEQGLTEEQARKATKVPLPSLADFNPWLTNTVREHRAADQAGTLLPGRDGTEYEPWLHTVNRHVLTGGIRRADAAWKNWIDSFKGTRAGRRVGYPRFKKKGVATDSFTVNHDRKKPGIRLATTRRLRIPTLGEIRIHDRAGRLHRKLAAGTVDIISVTVTRRGRRWYASLTVEEHTTPARTTRRQRDAGVVGVDLGVKATAALSTGHIIPNPRIKATHARKLAKLQQALARAQKGSRRRAELVRRIGQLTHLEARRREGHAHTLANTLTRGWETIGLEDLNVAGMTRTARGTLENPGRNVRAKSGLNRNILDTAPATLRRLLTYKSLWNGSRLVIIDRWAPTSKTCSTCGTVKPKLSLSERIYHCQACGLTLDRDINAARNIAALAAAVAPSTEETQNARRAGPSNPAPDAEKQRPAVKREGPSGSSPPGNGWAFPHQPDARLASATA
ncbi:RNA-guided endonuclease InsQ/TnpB family protein [Arthrobacter woluwensis]|uniref:RNA-guided endonuclease InsQ/TnpB family protein n=1 Tax=Arthrobacter woluwensis TaxID=156980 RepID=UPI0038172DAA